MFELEKSFSFEAGHSLPLHDGKCKRPHGHSYILKVLLRSKELIQTGPKTNMLRDFSEVSHIVKEMIQTYFDHLWINTTLQEESPTAEFIAKWIFDHLKPQLPELYAITLYETPTSSVTYKEPFSIETM